MNYRVGQRLFWLPFQSHKKPEQVSVIGLRKHGHAVLSNGWVVDEDGVAPGTNRMPGGSVRELHQHEERHA